MPSFYLQIDRKVQGHRDEFYGYFEIIMSNWYPERGLWKDEDDVKFFKNKKNN